MRLDDEDQSTILSILKSASRHSGRGTILKSNHDPGNAFEMRLDNRDDKTKRIERERERGRRIMRAR